MTIRSGLRQQLCPSLLRHHVLGVPVRPVLISLAESLLMLSVGSLRTPKRARQVACGAERSRSRVDAPRKPGRDLLQQPAVAVGITERGERAIAAMFGIRTADPKPSKQVGPIRPSVHAGGIVEDIADLDTATEQFAAGGLDVGDDQVKALGGAGCRRGDILTEDNRAPGARRRELDYAEVV